MSKVEDKKNWGFSEIGAYKLILIGILLLALIIRLKFFNVPEAVWWDEAEYLNAAKHWVYNLPYDISPQRQPLLPLLISVFYLLGIQNLAIIKLFVVVIPSLLVVFATYSLGRGLYNEKTGLISAFLMAIFWLVLFWTSRFSTDLLGLLFGILAIYYFHKGYAEKPSKRYLLLMGIFLALGFVTRVGNVIPGFVILFYLLITKRHKFISEKYLWLAIVLLGVIIVPYLVYNQVSYKDPFAFWAGYLGDVQQSRWANPIPWQIIDFFGLYLGSTLLVIFLIGIATLLINVLVGLDLVLNNKSKELSSNLLVLLMVATPLTFFLFVFKQAHIEPRWLFIMAPAVFIATAKGLELISNFITKSIRTDYSKHIAVIVILLILIVGTNYELRQASGQINSKKFSYLPLKQAGLWIKENSNEGEVIFNNGVPQNTFYSERLTHGIAGTEEYFEEQVRKLNPKYMVLSRLEKSPDWAYSWPERNTDKVRPVQAYFADQEKKQPILIIYEFL